MSPAPVVITEARSAADIAAARELLSEYIASLGVDLSFQDVAAEVADLPGKYAPPAGALLLARDAAGHPLGCVALRASTPAPTCEVKRLYVRPEARGHDVGRRLVEHAIRKARDAGYARMVLDTLPTMQAAHRLYASLGFRPIAPYYDNPVPGALYMALDLHPQAQE